MTTTKKKTPAKNTEKTNVEKAPLTQGEQNLKDDIAKSQALAVAANAVVDGQFEMNQLVGRIQATNAISGLLETMSLAQLSQIKESKTYKRLAGQKQTINGQEIDLGTWAGFCTAIGSSKRAIDEKIQNLHLLGEQALDNATAIGLTRSELRKLRQLDATDQQVIIGELEVAVGDKEAVVELIEDMALKHAREKEALNEEIENANNNLKADEKIIKDKNSKIDELSRQIAKQETADPMQKALQFAQQISLLEVGIGAEIGKLEKVFANIQQANNVDQLPQRLRANQGGALLVIKNWCDNLINIYGLGDISSVDESLDWAKAAEKAHAESQASVIE